MKNRHRINFAVCVILCCPVPLLEIVAADEKPATGKSTADSNTAVIGDDVAETDRLSKLIEDAVDDYQLFANESSSTELLARPVLRWRNVARGQDGEAMFVIWLQNGHPQAMASIYPWQGNLMHEFDLLCRKPGLVAKSKVDVIWAPLSAGVEFRKVPAAKTPATSPVARLREMKAIAERFEGTMTGWNSTDTDIEKLRLLPRALYRYEISGDGRSESHPIDGGLFAFATGTDPEIILILEAVNKGDSTAWEYACVRATSGGLVMRLDGAEVWTASKYPVQSPTNPHYTQSAEVPTPDAARFK